VEDLAQHHQLGQGGDGPEEVADQPVLEDRVRDRLEAQDHEPVLAHGIAREHVQDVEPRADLAQARRLLGPEQRGHARLGGVGLADEDALPGPGGEQTQRGRHRRAPGPALPRHEQEVPVEEGGVGHEA